MTIEGVAETYTCRRGLISRLEYGGWWLVARLALKEVSIGFKQTYTRLSGERSELGKVFVFT